MADDLFSQLFELFNQPGPVNLKLAAEVARHLAGERQPVDPWAAEELRELTRLAEYRIDEVAPFSVAPASDVLPVDGREWAERSLEGLVYLAEPFAGMVEVEGPGAEMLRPLAPAMVGMQLGTLVGALAGWVMASFDGGLPVTGEGPIVYVIPVIDRFADENGFDPREVRLWAALNEAAHHSMFRVGSTLDHLVELVTDYARTMKVGPERIVELMQGMSTEDLGEGIDPERLTGIFDTPESRAAQERLEAFLGLTAGYRRVLVERASAGMLPRREEVDAARDAERRLGEAAAGSAFAATFARPEAIERGRAFCEEVDRRYGSEALASMWTQEGRFPTVAELDDPVAWAARVLLDDLGG